LQILFLLEQQMFLNRRTASKSRANPKWQKAAKLFLQKKQWFLFVKMLLTPRNEGTAAVRIYAAGIKVTSRADSET